MNQNTLKKVLKFIGEYKTTLCISLVLTFITVILQLYVPILFGNAIDFIIDEGQVSFELIIHTLLWILICISISSICLYISNRLNNHMTYAVIQDVRNQAIRKIQTLPLSYLDQHPSGDIVSRVIADVDTLSDGLLLGFTQLFSGIVTILATLVFMFSKNVWLTLIVIALTPVSFIVAKVIASSSYQMFRKQANSRGKQTGFIDEMIGNIKVVKAFGHEEIASKQFKEMNQELEEYSRKATFYSSLTNPSTRFVNSIIYAVVAFVGAYFVLGSYLTVGGLSVMLNYANQYMKPFNEISSVVTELQNALACATRLFDFLEVETEKDAIDLEQDQVVSKMHQEKVEIDDIAFSYVRNKTFMEHNTIIAEEGKHIALVGPTGCGKTTLINLLMRFYDIQGGDIRIGGRSIYEMNRHELRQHFGMVLQDTWIKQGTIRENLLLAKQDASEEELIQAAKDAHSYEFIKRLPKKFDTEINEDSLSQGQKQLLCITRVMLCNPAMLILDEATSSIDTRTEVQIQKAFDTLMEGRTSFVVAHRLSTIRNADCILVMKDGKIIERGNHEELMQQNGFYKQLVESSFASVE